MWSWWSWERWALQSRAKKAQVLLILALGIQLLVWSVWGMYFAEKSVNTLEPANLSSNESEFELASAWMSQAELLDARKNQLQQDVSTGHEIWLDMGLEAKSLGLTVIEPDQVSWVSDAQLQESDAMWLVKGSFADVMRWVTQVAIQHPQLIMGEFNLTGAQEVGWVELKVHWRRDIQEFALASTPTTFNRSREAAETWFANHRRLLEPNTWPDFEGLKMPLGPSSFTVPWSEGGAEDWQRDRQHVLSQTPLNALRWRGAMLTRGRAVGLVEVGSEVWTVERGDIIGQGRYRVVDINADHMVLHMAVPSVQGQVDIRETVIGAHTETGTP